jgi:hypothetical protein
MSRASQRRVLPALTASSAIMSASSSVIATFN